MKQKSIIYLLLFSFTFGLTFSSCEDMLDVQSDRHSYETAQDTLYGYWGILKTLQNVGERYVLLGELRGDMVMANRYDGEVSDSLAAIADFTSVDDGACRYLQARDFYAIINNCNAYIAAADTNRVVYGGTSDNSKYMLREYAQVEAIRAWTYLQLVQLYGKVPFYLEPMTSTDAINNFINNPNHIVADKDNLPDLIGPRLLPLIAKANYNKGLTYPQYDMYKGMVHSSYCFFPLQLVMGDIYLNANRYEDAALQYYTWMSKDDFTSVPVTNENYGSVRESTFGGHRRLAYSVNYDGFNLGSAGQRNSKSETITVIPGTTNKLWGNVLRGVNEAFGYTAEIRVATNDTASVSSSVTLTPNTVKRQFIASDEFARLTRSYPALSMDRVKSSTLVGSEVAYDYYTLSGNNPDTARDCRYGWYNRTFAKTSGGEYTQDSMFITKQNPDGVFSTTYPVIYRRGLVWLRFAEAINRAGYPEYAYAVLRDGLFDGIVPTAKKCNVELIDDEDLICLRTEVVNVIEPEEGDENAEPTTEKIVTLRLLDKDVDVSSVELAENQSIITYNYTHTLTPERYAEFWNEEDDAVLSLNLNDNDSLEVTPAALRTYVAAKCAPMLNNTNEATFSLPGRSNVTSNLITCEYIPVNQVLKAESVPYLNFSTEQFTPTSARTTRLGIHQRGSGYEALTCWSDTIYNFEKCVKSKWPEYDGAANYYMTAKSDYVDYQTRLIQAVEELIIDELALECCFEGNRYNDLVRFSTRDNRGTQWLQDKINKRGGTPVVITQDNMYLRLPNR